MGRIESFFACTMLVFLAAAATYAEPLYLVMPHRGIEICDSEGPGPMKTVPMAVTEIVHTAQITFNVTYQDVAAGFNDAAHPERKQRLADALNYVSDVINQPGTLDILVTPSQFDGTNYVASAGTYFAYSTPGASKGFSLIRLTTGSKPNAAYPEIQITVDFGHNIYAGTGTPGVSQIDLTAVFVHEITHGLGFASLVQSTGRTDNTAGSQQAYTVFDTQIWRRTPSLELFSGVPVVFHGVAGDLAGGNLMFHGAEAATEYGGGYPSVYAPSPFALGSSMQHWDTTLVGGAVMQHELIPGQARRRYSPVDIGALIDIGYVNAQQTTEEGEVEGASEGEGEGSAEGSAEGEGEGTEPLPHLTVNPNPSGGVQYGEIEVGAIQQRTFQISNTGGGILSGGLTLTGTGFVALGTIAYNVGSGDTPAQIQIRFAPGYTGTFTGNARFSGGENGPINVALHGTGIETPAEGEGAAEGEGEGETPPQDCSCAKAGQTLPDPAQLFLGALSVILLLVAAQQYRFRD